MPKVKNLIFISFLILFVSKSFSQDFDGDGIQDSIDVDDDNDGVPDMQECQTSVFFWSDSPSVSGTTATGTINGVSYTYTSSAPIGTTPNLYSHSTFPANYGVPNQLSIKNTAITTNSISFGTPIKNPVLVFSSIGNGSSSVGINFGSEIDLLWSQAVVKNSSTQITGTEGYAIVRLNGVFSNINFNSL